MKKPQLRNIIREIIKEQNQPYPVACHTGIISTNCQCVTGRFRMGDIYVNQVYQTWNDCINDTNSYGGCSCHSPQDTRWDCRRHKPGQNKCVEVLGDRTGQFRSEAECLAHKSCSPPRRAPDDRIR